MDGVGSVSFIRWNVSERRNVRVRDDVSLHKKRDECDMMILLNEERLFLCIYLREVIFGDFISSRCLLLHSYPFERFRMMNPKSLTRWNCDEKCDRIRSSDRSGYHIVSKIFDFFFESGTSYDSCLVGLFSSMWSWMSGWDPTTRICVPTHPWNHMNLLIKPIGTCDKNLASWFELYRICFVTCLASRFLRFSSSSTFVCLVVFWKKEIDGDLAMKMSDHWDTLEHTWCVTAILNSRI